MNSSYNTRRTANTPSMTPRVAWTLPTRPPLSHLNTRHHIIRHLLSNSLYLSRSNSLRRLLNGLLHSRNSNRSAHSARTAALSTRLFGDAIPKARPSAMLAVFTSNHARWLAPLLWPALQRLLSLLHLLTHRLLPLPILHHSTLPSLRPTAQGTI